MAIRFPAAVVLMVALVTACGKSPEEKRLETIEVQTKTTQQRDTEFNRIFREAMVVDTNSRYEDDKSGMPLTILGSWRRGLDERYNLLKGQSKLIAHEKFEDSKKTYDALENAVQWTDAAIAEVRRYTQLYYELSFLKNSGTYNQEFNEKLNEADLLHQKIAASIKISEEQEELALNQLSAYGQARELAIKRQREAEAKRLAAERKQQELAAEAARRRAELEKMQMQLKELTQPLKTLQRMEIR